MMLEKGRRFAAEDFPKSNWNLRRWLWMPAAGFRGIFKMTFLRHVTVLSGVGVGGGSLVYANTLPTPKDEFFALPSWGHLADWKKELEPHYATALRMLGAVQYPRDTYSDQVLRDIANDIGRPDQIVPARVAVYFGEPGKTVPDPYFGGEGPDRTGCIQCGACMTGCRHNAKNTLDKNYLWLAEKRGLQHRSGHRGDVGARACRRRLPDRRHLGHRLVRQAPAHLHRAQRDLRGRRDRHGAAAAEAEGQRATDCRGSPTASAASSAPTPSRSSA